MYEITLDICTNSMFNYIVIYDIMNIVNYKISYSEKDYYNIINEIDAKEYKKLYP